MDVFLLYIHGSGREHSSYFLRCMAATYQALHDLVPTNHCYTKYKFTSKILQYTWFYLPFPFPLQGRAVYARRLRPQHKPISHRPKNASKYWTVNSHGRNNKEHNHQYSHGGTDPTNWLCTLWEQHCEAHQRIYKPPQVTARPQWSNLINWSAMYAGMVQRSRLNQSQ